MAEIKRRIGNDLHIKWSILTGGQSVPLTGRDLTLILTGRNGRRQIEFESLDNVASFVWRGMDQSECGRYIFTLWENMGKPDQYVVDSIDSICLVPNSNMVSDGDTSADIYIGGGLSAGSTVDDFVKAIDVDVKSAIQSANDATDNANDAAANASTIAATIKAAYDNGEFKGEKGDKGDKGDSVEPITTEEISVLS